MTFVILRRFLHPFDLVLICGITCCVITETSLSGARLRGCLGVWLRLAESGSIQFWYFEPFHL